jgi:predicted RNA binding protein YcfA (HicA-like mRNA interferase family)
MSSLNNLKPERVIKAFEKAGWKKRGQKGSHVHLTKEGSFLCLINPATQREANKTGAIERSDNESRIDCSEFFKVL